MQYLSKIIAAAALLSMGGTASATVVSGALTGGSAFTNGGTFQIIAPPAAVGNDRQQNNNLYAFNQLQNAVLLNNIPADFGPALIAGQRFNSHFVFFDPGPSRSAIGTVTFNAPILAVLALTAKMNASDASFGVPGVTYDTPAARGLEAATDSFSVSGNTLSLRWTASDPGDYIRVLTASAVPEPASWALMLAGFSLLGAALRRPQRTLRVRYT